MGAKEDPRNPAAARCDGREAVGRPDLACAQWILGGPESDFAFPEPSDRFWGAHSPFQLPNEDPNKTNIVIYDNRLHRPEGQYTRALELQSFGKAVQSRSHVIPSIAGEQLIKVGDEE